MVEKIARWAFFVVVFCLPIQTVWLLYEPVRGGEKWQYGTIGIYVVDVVLLIACVMWLLAPLLKKQTLLRRELFHRSQSTVFLLLLLFWSVVSIFWADDRLLTMYTVAKLALAVGLFLIAQSLDLKGRMLVIRIFCLAAVFQASLGVWQFLSQSSFASTLLGMSSYETWQPVVSVLKNESGRWLRAYGTLPHPNMLGSYLGVALVMMVGCNVFYGRSFLYSGSVRLKSSAEWGVTVFSVFVVLLGLIVSFSRSAWVGTVLGFGMLVVTVFLRKDVRRQQQLALWLGIVSIAAVVFVGLLHETVFPRLEGVTMGQERSVVDREVLFRQAKELIQEHLWMGVGVGNYTSEVLQVYPDMPIWDVQPVHNVFMLVWAELGVVGEILFLGFFVSVVVRGSRKVFQQENAIFFIAFLALVPSLFLDHFLWDSNFGLLFFFLLSGL